MTAAWIRLDEATPPRTDDRQDAERTRAAFPLAFPESDIAIRIRDEAAEIIAARAGEMVTPELARERAAQIAVVVLGELLAMRRR